MLFLSSPRGQGPASSPIFAMFYYLAPRLANDCPIKVARHIQCFFDRAGYGCGEEWISSGRIVVDALRYLACSLGLSLFALHLINGTLVPGREKSIHV